MHQTGIDIQFRSLLCMSPPLCHKFFISIYLYMCFIDQILIFSFLQPEPKNAIPTNQKTLQNICCHEIFFSFFLGFCFREFFQREADLSWAFLSIRAVLRMPIFCEVARNLSPISCMPASSITTWSATKSGSN